MDSPGSMILLLYVFGIGCNVLVDCIPVGSNSRDIFEIVESTWSPSVFGWIKRWT